MYPLASISLRTELSMKSLEVGVLGFGDIFSEDIQSVLNRPGGRIRNLEKMRFHIVVALFQQLAIRDPGMFGQHAQRKLLVRSQNLCPFDHRHEKLFCL